ncbi:MAG: TatA/E family twin arginine-targeting protein translocase [Bryobacteraceae bacterium]|jgi:TatA/E family protein of Tat protein translocase
MGSLGVPEMMVIFILALVLFGPKKLPEIGRTLGKAITEFRKASSELKETFNKEIQNLERETESIKEVTNQYQYDTYNYDYSSNETNPDGAVESGTDQAASPSSESASAPQGAELPSADAPEGAVAQGSEHETQAAPEPGGVSEHSDLAAGGDAVATPAEHKA